MKIKSALVLGPVILAVALTTGCTALYEPKPMVSELGHQEVLSHTASVKNTFVFERDSSLIFCAEPPPDAAFTQSLNLDVTFALIHNVSGGGEDGGDDDEGSAEEEMDGRTPSVMLARELLYRLCEFSKNHQLDTPTAIDLYKQNLDIIKSVAEKTAKNTTIKVGETLSNQETFGFQESVSASFKAGKMKKADKKKDDDEDDDDKDKDDDDKDKDDDDY